jgi:signal transduction histidine kinase
VSHAEELARAAVSHAEQIARAEHELRGAATALALVCEALRRDPAASHHAAVIDAQLDRLRGGLSDLAAARNEQPTGGEGERAGRVEVEPAERVEVEPPGRLEVEAAECEEVELSSLTIAAAGPWGDTAVEWEGGPVTARLDRRRFAQALGNVLANAAEHGSGPVRVIGRPHEGGVRVEVRNPGRGLQIARRAAEELGGRLSFEIVGDSAVATLDLPDA